MLTKDQKTARRSIWRLRRLRFAGGVTMLVNLLLAGAVVAIVNYLSFRHHARWDASAVGYYRLSDKTVSLLRGIDADLTITTFFRAGEGLYDDVRRLLKEYEYAAAANPKLRLRMVHVDPDRDLVKTRELAQTYGITESEVVVFDCSGRRKHVGAKEIMDQQIQIEGRQAYRKTVAFRGELAFSSAIQSVVQASQPVVYFVTGHGERSLEEYGDGSGGYSRIGALLARDNMDVRPLSLAEAGRVPANASAVIVAGPRSRLSQAECDLLAKYLEGNGRLLVLLSGGEPAGLGKLLESWGIKIGADIVVGLTLTGQELVVSEYSAHPITEKLKGLTTMFYRPSSVEAAAGAGQDETTPDRPHVSVLAANTDKGWADANREEYPPRFDQSVDRRGPISIAVAAEKGPLKGINVELRPTRLVVLGDATFVSNAALTSGMGGNSDFFLSCLNWLLERDTLLAIAPKPPNELRLSLDRRQWQMAFALIVVGVPGLAALVGLGVWLRWRR